MSKNCINCVIRPRTGGDLLCDECRSSPAHGSVSDTPRTDECVRDLDYFSNGKSCQAIASFARDMERENAQLRAVLSMIRQVALGNVTVLGLGHISGPEEALKWIIQKAASPLNAKISHE